MHRTLLNRVVGAVLGGLLLYPLAVLHATAKPLEFSSKPSVRANPNPAVPLAAVLTFEATEKTDTRIEISAGDFRRVLEYRAVSDGMAGLPLIGFLPGAEHQIRVVISNSGGDSATSTVNFTAPRLPVDVTEFPIIQTQRLSNAPMEAGVTMFNPRRRIPPSGSGTAQTRFQQSFGMLTAVDSAGNVIWYYRGDSRISDFELLRNGNIIFLTQDYRAVEIDLLGNIVTQWYAKNRPQGPIDGATPVEALTFHHDIDELPNGNFLVLSSLRKKVSDYYTGELDADAPRKDQWVMGDEVIEFQRDGKVVWRWNAFEYLDVMRIGYDTFSGYWDRRGFPETIDWSHANSVVPLDDKSILVNYRLQSAVTKIEKASGEIVWIAGEPSGWGPLKEKLLKLEGDDAWFWHQHGPTITPSGKLLLFDNGNFQARPFDEPVPPAKTRSRVIAYELDEDARTLRPSWSSIIPGDPPVVSFAMGSTQYLPQTGNVLAGYGFLLSQEEIRDRTWHTLFGSRVWTRVREYTRESPSRVVWELTLQAGENDIGLGWNLFGARRVRNFPPHR